MIQGSGSDVGKSLIVAGLCRAYRNRGLKVLPFKPQNMSNNASVTPDGGEIGRAQAMQALACGAPLSVDMNPVLLKPQTGFGAQVVVQGKVVGTAAARDYQQWKPKLLGAVLESFAKLAANADLVLVEGAGSASEVNLRQNDIANMGFARAAGVPVILVGDIDRGGVIAQIVGTKSVIAAEDAAMIRGFIVNKFRGDPTLFADGMAFIAQRSGWPALGLIPFCAEAALLPAEDSFGLSTPRPKGGGKILIAVPVLPGIANFDDLDPLRLEPDVEIAMVRSGAVLPAEARLVLLPGSKTTIADLAAFRREGWDIDLAAHLRRGGHVIGLCGGYQMLGRMLRDPDGVEGPRGEAIGLGLLDIETELTGEKMLAPVEGVSAADGAPFKGYEMHLGRTYGPGCEAPLLILADGRREGTVSADGRVSGSYVHGLFSDPAQRASLMARLGGEGSGLSYEASIERALDALANHLEAHMDLDHLLTLAS
ncbi:cobyric acid synthase [Methylocella silvestris]|uniref:Cobyric acid synthase n=1 Tax=Methylocella silvestris TaxID=199596 RepID=A0A2J7TMJ4_METSI|nr:cobyric acid synthase [Methylocella silvestris]PNG27991.1 cobyric acid synthase CobQ [Methylocella silvestris]